MRRSAAEKLELIRLVEGSDLPVRTTLRQLGIARSTFWRDDVRWYGTDGEVDLSPDARHLAFHLDGAACDDTDLYVMINAGEEDLVFTVQEGPPERWRRVVDTSRPSPDDIREPGDEVPLVGTTYAVASRSAVVLVGA